ncbi:MULTISPECIES: hypothetical protein [Streptomyces]|uniref:Uncharacterized protein n=1 Tax=Streptomyces lavenduligriseus TaxID=67315 RepID=A0ABT0NLR7_9ACTN|nr:hypothetical protein [Streptomyces lavenduligriseus]MCL3992403.1 hypothetical protein [Streptomyces lavenduligriseus]
MNALALRLAGPRQPRGERPALTPDRDTASLPTRSTLLGPFGTAQSVTHQDTGAFHRYAARSSPYGWTGPAAGSSTTFPLAPDRPRTLPTKLSDYAMKEAAA